MSPKVFFEFTLPNATTWSFFSLLLAVALFFKFSRLLSMRNWDVLTVYLLVPGLLLLQEAHKSYAGASDWLLPAYVWLLSGSGYLLVRCIYDLSLVRRPALSPNLSVGGLGWLACALGVCLISVALRQPQQEGPAETAKLGTVPVAVDDVVGLVNQQLKHAPVAPVDDDTRADFWVWPSLALLCHLAVVIGLVVIGCRHFQDAHAGLAAATLYLLLPYTAIHIGQLHHVWPAAMIVWAVAAYRHPMISALLLGLAAGSAYFPALIIPVWFSFYRGRGASRFVVICLVAAGLSLGVRIWWQGGVENTLQAALEELQVWKRPITTEGIWTSAHWAYRIPVFIAYLAFLVATTAWPNPKNLAHVIALTAALLIGVQFGYADQGGVYVLWYLPLLLLMAFRPNLVDRRPPIIVPEDDRLMRLGRKLGRVAARVLRIPEPTVKVS